MFSAFVCINVNLHRETQWEVIIILGIHYQNWSQNQIKTKQSVILDEKFTKSHKLFLK